MNETANNDNNPLIELLNQNPGINIEIPSRGETYILKRIDSDGRLITYMTLTLHKDSVTNEIYPSIYQQQGKIDTYASFLESGVRFQSDALPSVDYSTLDYFLLLHSIEILNSYLSLDKIARESFKGRVNDNRNNLTEKFPLEHSTIEYSNEKVLPRLRELITNHYNTLT